MIDAESFHRSRRRDSADYQSVDENSEGGKEGNDRQTSKRGSYATNELFSAVDQTKPPKRRASHDSGSHSHQNSMSAGLVVNTSKRRANIGDYSSGADAYSVREQAGGIRGRTCEECSRCVGCGASLVVARRRHPDSTNFTATADPPYNQHDHQYREGGDVFDAYDGKRPQHAQAPKECSGRYHADYADHADGTHYRDHPRFSDKQNIIQNGMNLSRRTRERSTTRQVGERSRSEDPSIHHGEERRRARRVSLDDMTSPPIGGRRRGRGGYQEYDDEAPSATLVAQRRAKYDRDREVGPQDHRRLEGRVGNGIADGRQGRAEHDTRRRADGNINGREMGYRNRNRSTPGRREAERDAREENGAREWRQREPGHRTEEEEGETKALGRRCIPSGGIGRPNQSPTRTNSGNAVAEQLKRSKTIADRSGGTSITPRGIGGGERAVLFARRGDVGRSSPERSHYQRRPEGRRTEIEHGTNSGRREDALISSRQQGMQHDHHQQPSQSRPGQDMKTMRTIVGLNGRREQSTDGHKTSGRGKTGRHDRPTGNAGHPLSLPPSRQTVPASSIPVLRVSSPKRSRNRSASPSRQNPLEQMGGFGRGDGGWQERVEERRRQQLQERQKGVSVKHGEVDGRGGIQPSAPGGHVPPSAHAVSPPRLRRIVGVEVSPVSC